jgi:hypothetical protein
MACLAWSGMIRYAASDDSDNDFEELKEGAHARIVDEALTATAPASGSGRAES